MSARLPDEIRAVMDNGIPVVLATCSASGEPNVSIVSEVYYVDPEHVALSHQFFNKTVRNVRENPRAVVWVMSPQTFDTWNLDVEFDHAETSGPVFDALDMQIEAIASLVGLKGIFKLKSADIYRVRAVTKNVAERIPPGEIADPDDGPGA